MKGSVISFTVFAAGLLLGGNHIQAADLPPATRDLVAKRPFLAEFLKGEDAELAVGSPLLADANRQGEVKIIGTWSDKKFRLFTRAFTQRYPDIRVSYARGSTRDRGLKLMISYKSGQYPADVTISFGSYFRQMVQAGMLADLRGLPAFKGVAAPFRDDDGLWVGQKVTYRCMAYNTSKVAKGDLPRTWDELVANPRWKGGNLALNNYPHGWLLPLQGLFGERWTRDFVHRLFALKPQIRKEGQTATVSLVAAGEFDAVVLAPAYRVKEYQNKGAPVAFHCPEPVPSGPVQMAVVRSGPREAAAKVFVNWFLSREGQISQWAADGEAPIHKDLQKAEFLAFPDQVLGRKPAYLTQNLMEHESKKLSILWKKFWQE